jgi:uncharacterized membrane protein (DUF485 family)
VSTGFRGRPVTPTDVAWLLTQSQAQRGRRVPLDSTCPTFSDWATTCLGATGQQFVKQLLRVPYPEPTPVTVVASLAYRRSAIASSFAPKLYGSPFFIGTTPAAYTLAVGTLVVEWVCAGATFSAMLDLGANALSLPACDQVTVSYFSFVPTLPMDISVSLLPVMMPGAVGTLTRTPTIAPAGGQIIALTRQAFARRWKATADSEPNVSPPGVVGPVVVQLIDSLGPIGSAEAVRFGAGVAGVAASDQGWIECTGPATGYICSNLGAGDARVKLCEQVTVT